MRLRLPLAAARTWGGARKGAGRKPRGRPSMPHVTRPKIDPRYPMQVTIRATRGLPSLRFPRLFSALRRAIARASVDRFRVIHFSVQQDHGHFIVEGDEPRRTRGGVHGLAIRLALAVNRLLGRRLVSFCGLDLGYAGPNRKTFTPAQRLLPSGGLPDATHVPCLKRHLCSWLHPDAHEHGLRAAQLPEASACARVHRPTKLRAPLFGVAATTGAHRSRAGYSSAVHLDGARRLAARRRAVAGRGTAGGIAATAPHLIWRMLGQPRAPIGPAPASPGGSPGCDEL